MTPPVEPAPSRWQFPEPPAQGDLVGLGGDLEPGTILTAYRQGIFPMPVDDRRPTAWWSPLDRAVIPIGGLLVSRSMRRSARRFEVTVDRDCAGVIDGCADPTRPGGWIDEDIRAAYLRLHQLGWVHSVEVWRSGRLAGGLYGVAIGGLFAGESMFHRERDASKVALMALLGILDDGESARLVDVQWPTDHLRGLGAVSIGRAAYLALLRTALALPLPACWR